MCHKNQMIKGGKGKDVKTVGNIMMFLHCIYKMYSHYINKNIFRMHKIINILGFASQMVSVTTT